MSSNRLNLFGFLAASLLFSCSDATALVTATGDSAHTSERALQRVLRSELQTQTEFPFWKNVGYLNESTAVYMGNGYVLTAAHVGAGKFQLADGSRYAPIPETEQRFRNSDGSFSDLCVFRVSYRASDSIADLPSVPLGPVCPGQGSFVLLIGAGSGNSSNSRIQFASSRDFSWNEDFRIRWGLNRVAHQFASPMKTYHFSTPGYSTKFSRGEYRCQATPGDSGGAAFVYNRQTHRWELGGIILAVDSRVGEAEFGNQTYIADLTILPDQVFKLDGLFVAR